MNSLPGKFYLRFVILMLLSSVCNSNIWAVEPTVQTVSITAGSSACNEIDLSFIPGNGSKRIIIASANNPVTALPTDGQAYTAGSLFGTGSNLGNGNFVVYNQSGTNTTVTGLTGGVQYFFAVFEFNGNMTTTDYLLTNNPTANAIAMGFWMSVSSPTGGAACNGDSVQLEVHNAHTYQWSPSASLSSSTDSLIWARPSSTTMYTVFGTDTVTGCTNTRTITVTIYQLPNVSIGSFPNKCINAPLVTLTSGSPSGGVYSGNGITNNQFNPAVAGLGQHVITYTYTDIHNCSSIDTSNIIVINTPAVTISDFLPVCINNGPFVLNGGSPSGGSYSGPGVSAGQFNPVVAGVGQHLIRYIYSNLSGCSDTAETMIDVKQLPTVNFASVPPACLNTTPFLLTQGNPAGGTYSGNGVSNDEFYPLVTGAGTFLLTYTYADSFNCVSSDTSNITVFTLPAVSFSSLNSVCQNTGPVTLSGGSPAGGTYSGPAVGGGIFYTGLAGAGQHTLTYTYISSNGCSNSANRTITVNAIPDPDLGNDVTVCSNESAVLTAGTYTSYTWSTGSHNAAITVDTNGHGLGTFPFILTVTNSFGCANRDTILVTFDGCVSANDLAGLQVEVPIAFPNPTTTSFTVLSKFKIDLFVYDIRGSVLIEKKNVNGVINFGEELIPGIFILRMHSGQDVINKLIIKK